MNRRVRLIVGSGPVFGESSNVLIGKTKSGKNRLKPRRIVSVPFVRLREITKVVAQRRNNGAIQLLRKYGL